MVFLCVDPVQYQGNRIKIRIKRGKSVLLHSIVTKRTIMEKELSSYFTEVEDPRVTGRCLHLLPDILMISLLTS